MAHGLRLASTILGRGPGSVGYLSYSQWRINPTIFVSVNCTGFAGESMKTSKGAPKLGARTVEEGFVAGDRIDRSICLDRQSRSGMMTGIPV